MRPQRPITTDGIAASRSTNKCGCFCNWLRRHEFDEVGDRNCHWHRKQLRRFRQLEMIHKALGRLQMMGSQECCPSQLPKTKLTNPNLSNVGQARNERKKRIAITRRLLSMPLQWQCHKKYASEVEEALTLSLRFGGTTSINSDMPLFLAGVVKRTFSEG